MSSYDRLQIKRREKCQLRSRTSSRAQETRTCKTARFGTHDGTSFISKFQPTRGKGGEKGREEGWRVGREFDWVTVLGSPPPNLRSPCGADQHYRATTPSASSPSRPQPEIMEALRTIARRAGTTRGQPPSGILVVASRLMCAATIYVNNSGDPFPRDFSAVGAPAPSASGHHVRRSMAQVRRSPKLRYILYTYNMSTDQLVFVIAV